MRGKNAIKQLKEKNMKAKDFKAKQGSVLIRPTGEKIQIGTRKETVTEKKKEVEKEIPIYASIGEVYATPARYKHADNKGLNKGDLVLYEGDSWRVVADINELLPGIIIVEDYNRHCERVK